MFREITEMLDRNDRMIRTDPIRIQCASRFSFCQHKNSSNQLASTVTFAFLPQIQAPCGTHTNKFIYEQLYNNWAREWYYAN